MTRVTIDRALIEQTIAELLPEQMGVSHFALRQKLRAALLRRQHEAIVKLREALESVERRSRWSDSYINDVAEKALKDTEEFQ